MFSKVLVKLISVFLILFISIISATPATKDNTQALAPRQPPARLPYWHPAWRYRNVCPRIPRHVWEKRECLYTLGPRPYRDVCAYLEIGYMWNGRLGRMRPFTRKAYRYVMHECPENTRCMKRVVNDLQAIICAPIDRKGKRPADRDDDKSETGESEPKRAYIEGDTQFQQTVTINKDMPGASASAVLISECRTITNVHSLIFLCSCWESIEFR